jgi:hypothetical protein
VNPDLYLHARAETVDDRHKTIDRESVKIRVANPREVGRCNACAAVRGADGQLFPIEHLDDFGGQDGLELFDIGVLMPEIAVCDQRQTFSFPLNSTGVVYRAEPPGKMWHVSTSTLLREPALVLSCSKS